MAEMFSATTNLEKHMNPKSPINEAVIANALLAILERLDNLEKATNVLAGIHMKNAISQSSLVRSTEQALLIHWLEKLTLKRHAVLTATLGGQSYQAIAKAMECDVTTVKLHLKAALDVLGVRNRSMLMANSPSLLDFITDEEYESRYGMGKTWWLVEKPELMAVLRATKPANNQHTK